MHKVIIPNSIKRDLKKIEKQVQNMALELLYDLANCPYLGVNLSGQFKFLYKLEFTCFKVQYRIAYAIDRKRNEIHIVHVGTREKFYQELKRRL